MKIAYLAALGAFALSTTAQAQTVTAANPQSVVAALQAGGYKAILGKDSSGDPKIESASSGSRFIVNFYGCTNNVRCSSVTFWAGWSGTKATLHDINEWNKNKRFSRAYIDSAGDPIMEFDVDLDEGGMSQALFIDNLEVWEGAIAAYKKHIGI